MRTAILVLRIITCLAGLALPAAAVAQSQASPAPVTTGLILGRVVDAASGRPIGRAIVTLESVSSRAPDAGSRPRAMTDVEPGEWYDPAFLQRLASAASKISIADGEKKALDIKFGGL